MASEIDLSLLWQFCTNVFEQNIVGSAMYDVATMGTVAAIFQPERAANQRRQETGRRIKSPNILMSADFKEGL